MSKARKAPTAVGGDEGVAAATVSKAPTKSAHVLTLLQREVGATLAELMEATGWKPHTTRAMLTGLRKKGHPLERRKRDDLTCYHLPEADA
jgi:DNA-binding MarR family transcriptional regulator